MAFSIKLANLLKDKSDSFSEIEGYSEVFDHNWKAFVEGELNHSNELNNRALGGRQRSNTDEDEDPAN